MNRLQETYQTKIAPQLKADLSLENVHQIPQLKKIVV